jgi:predicted enzyme related to lactoylglutathione lyase
MTGWCIFPKETRYFSPSRSRFMINYRVGDLDALLARLQRRKVGIDPKRVNEPYGKFAWIRDRNGNRIELWQPTSPKPAPRRR